MMSLYIQNLAEQCINSVCAQISRNTTQYQVSFYWLTTWAISIYMLQHIQAIAVASSNILKPTFKPESDKQFLQSSFKKLKRAISTNASPLHISDELTSHSHALKLADNTQKQLLIVWACLHQCHKCVITEL